MLVRDFASAVEYLSNGRSKVDRPLENNTRLIARSEDQIAVRLHETDVVTYHADGRIVLNSGGWLTVTTKDRINRYLGDWHIRIGSDRGRWFLFRYDEDTYEHIRLSMFYDGIVILPDGSVETPQFPNSDQNRADEEMTRKIDNFVAGFARKLTAGMPLPSGGDCWDCAMYNQNNQTLGDASGSHEHLLLHINEKYYVPSLALNAIKERGYLHPNVILMMTPDGMGGRNAFTRGFRFALRRYLRKRLMPHLAHR